MRYVETMVESVTLLMFWPIWLLFKITSKRKLYNRLRKWERLTYTEYTAKKKGKGIELQAISFRSNQIKSIRYDSLF